jgi:putative nucleotidyltransferase with HDIG domain
MSTVTQKSNRVEPLAPVPAHAPPRARRGEAVRGDGADGIATALQAAFSARLPGLHASTPLVQALAARVGRQLGLDSRSAALLDVSVRLRDIGMVALPDSVVLSSESLSADDWVLMNRHPDLGSELLARLPAVAAAAPIVRAHHERWDGEGYPAGLRGQAIPLLSQVIAICDAFVAMSTDRPYRRGVGANEALEYVCLEAGSQFGPEMVDAFAAVLSGGRAAASPAPAPVPGAARKLPTKATHDESGAMGRRGLTSAIEELDLIPAFAPAYERLLAAVATPEGGNSGEIISAIESDTGLTVAVLRDAQSFSSGRPIANVADAAQALGATGIQAAITNLPLAAFPWRTSPLEVLMHRARIHAQAVARAAERLTRESALVKTDDVLVAALLHDVGKLALARITDSHAAVLDDRTTTPEERARQEQRDLGLDHASLGGLLLRRWGLPERLAQTVAAHHQAEAEDQVATYVRLADMVAHQAQGEAIDRTVMLRLASVCGLSADALRDVLFDLPHASGSRRRRAEPSPLSKRETMVLRELARGKVYKQIGADLGLAASTVRSHLHRIYEKLGVGDRAQAVLRATEMGWI